MVRNLFLICDKRLGNQETESNSGTNIYVVDVALQGNTTKLLTENRKIERRCICCKNAGFSSFLVFSFD